MHKNFHHQVKVYYEDTDAGGVVYYANYLKYIERARTEALSKIGLSNTQIKNKFGALIIVKSCNIEYKKSAHLEDELNIVSHIISLKKTSLIMKQLIIHKKELITDAEIHLVFVNSEGKPEKIPSEIIENFMPYVKNEIKT
tara:strand:- start:433 stop:855 length:423 start_codon:yes stop_codon:yes gene_type:complete